jgi:hypothetical protein
MRSLSRRVAALALASSLFPALATAASAASAPPAAAATPAATPAVDHGAAGTLTLVHGPTAESRTAGPSTARHGHTTLPRFTPRTRAEATAQAPRTAQTAQAPATVHSPTVVKNPTPDFKTLSLDEEHSTLDPPNGSAHFVTPPDTQMAVSPTQMVEMVNLAEKVYSPANGSTLLGPVDLNTIFHVPLPSASGAAWSLSDPRVVYDPESQTWFATAISFQCADPACNSFGGGQVYLAVSSDPLQGWAQYLVASNGTANPVPVPGGDLYDQAKLGVNSDKLTVGFDVYNPAFQGAELVVIDKAAVVQQAGTASTTTFPTGGPNAAWFSLAPAQSLTPTTTAYVAYNNSDTGAVNAPPPSVGVISITGVPGSANLPAFHEDDPAITSTSVPPAAAQPQPPGANPLSPDTIDTGDDRFLNSVWRNGLLWTFGNTGCIPPTATDNTPRACARLVQVSTSGTPAVVQDFDVSSVGKDTYYPAVVFNGNGDSVGVFSESSDTEFVSVVAGGQLSDEAGSFSALASIQPGEATHDDTGVDCFPGDNPARWGDYSAAVPDPSAANAAWVAGEYAAAPTAKVADCNWGTAAGRLTFQPPSITSLSQNAGKNGGGDLVTITGANFSANATVAFSGTPAVSPVVVSSSKITVHTPALSNATTDVVVTTPYGTSIPTTASKFRFAAPPMVTAVVPNIGALAGGNTVTLTGTGFTAATVVHFGDGLATNIVVASDSKMTVTAPAHASGPVDVTVDVSSLIGAPHAGDTYTYKVRSGYWMVDEAGSVFGFGDSAYYGGAEALTQNTVVDIEPTPSGSGYWILDDAGNVFPFGDAVWQGQPTSLAPDESATSISANPAGTGYWVFTDKGRAFGFGDAPFKGDMAGTPLNGPVLGSVATPTGKGYYMVASDGGIFAFGDAQFKGSMGGKPLNGPVVGLAPTPDNGGYWLVATDGGIFSFGDALFHGSMGGKPLNAPMVGAVAYGDGYLMVGTDGGIFDFSAKPFLGSLGGQQLSTPITNVAPLNG